MCFPFKQLEKKNTYVYLKTGARSGVLKIMNIQNQNSFLLKKKLRKRKMWLYVTVALLIRRVQLAELSDLIAQINDKNC